MSDKTKQRTRARMARTGESYQAAWNALHAPPRGASVIPAEPFEWPCDVCGDSLFADTPHSMMQWLSKLEKSDESFGRTVVGLFFVHKGACDDVVRHVSHKLQLSDSWVDLRTLIGDDWYRESRAVRELRTWCEGHEARLDTFFTKVASAREQSWRPPFRDLSDMDDLTRRRQAFLDASELRRERLGVLTTASLTERLQRCFAPEFLAEARS